MKELKIGIIGFDTSHVPAFTKLLNDENDTYYVPGGRVVAGYPSFSPDLKSSYSRVDGFKTELMEKWGIKIAPSIKSLLKEVDAVLLESVDGRRHLKEAIPVLKAGKPVFIDKPMAASFKDANKIAALAKRYNCPLFSSSSLRYDYNILKIKKDAELGAVMGCDAFSPALLDPTNPGLFWYGVHGVEILYNFMGKGCKKLYSKYTEGIHLVIGEWEDGRIGTVRGIRKGAASYGARVFGEHKVEQTTYAENIPIYAQLLREIISFFQTGKSPVAIEETLEIMQFMQAAILSEKKGKEVLLSQIK
jgi:predicted dehydrogenase